VGRDGFLLLTAATGSRLADSAASVALVLAILARTHDTRLSGLVVGAFTIPTLVTGPVLGAYLDRLRHRKPLFAANQVLLALALGAVDLLAGHTAAWVLLACGAGAGLTAPVLSGGYSSLVPVVVPPRGLARANALDSASYNVGGLIGPALVAAVAGTIGPGAALAGTAMVAAAGLPFVLAAPMPAAVPTGTARGSPVQGSPAREPLRTALADGARLLRRSRPLLTVTAGTTVGQFFQGFLPLTCALLAVTLGRGTAGGGWLLTALSVGGLAWSLVSERVNGWCPARTVLIGAQAGMFAFLGLMAVVRDFWACLALATAVGALDSASLTGTLAVRQRETPAARYAQVSATAASLKTGAYALGSAAAGLATASLSPRELMAGAAAGQLLAAAPMLVRWGAASPPAERPVASPTEPSSPTGPTAAPSRRRTPSRAVGHRAGRPRRSPRNRGR
jgi:MFS family permease